MPLSCGGLGRVNEYVVAWVSTVTTLLNEYVLHFGTLCLHKVVTGNCSQTRCMYAIHSTCQVQYASCRLIKVGFLVT